MNENNNGEEKKLNASNKNNKKINVPLYRETIDGLSVLCTNADTLTNKLIKLQVFIKTLKPKPSVTAITKVKPKK